MIQRLPLLPLLPVWRFIAGMAASYRQAHHSGNQVLLTREVAGMEARRPCLLSLSPASSSSSARSLATMANVERTRCGPASLRGESKAPARAAPSYRPDGEESAKNNFGPPIH